MSASQLIAWIIVGGFVGTLAGRTATLKKEGLGHWANLLVGMAGAVLGGEFVRLFRIDFGLGELRITFEELIAAFVGSLVIIFLWRILRKSRSRDPAGKH